MTPNIGPRPKTPLGAVIQGLAAGVIGNAIYTAYQAATSKSGEESEPPPKDWSETPAPAQVGQRISEGVLQRDVPLEKADLLTNTMHWLYGTSWGAVYGIIEESIDQPVVSGVTLAGAVMAADYTLLPAMKLYDPPWKYPAGTLGKDFANHLVYGLAVAAAYRAIDAALNARS